MQVTQLSIERPYTLFRSLLYFKFTFYDTKMGKFRVCLPPAFSCIRLFINSLKNMLKKWKKISKNIKRLITLCTQRLVLPFSLSSIWIGPNESSAIVPQSCEAVSPKMRVLILPFNCVDKITCMLNGFPTVLTVPMNIKTFTKWILQDEFRDKMW